MPKLEAQPEATISFSGPELLFVSYAVAGIIASKVGETKATVMTALSLAVSMANGRITERDMESVMKKLSTHIDLVSEALGNAPKSSLVPESMS